MKIHDPRFFTLIVPTFEGTRFLRRTLEYFRQIAFRGRIVLSDNSTGEHRRFVASCAREYPDLRIDAHEFPHEIAFLDKLVATLERLESPFVMLHAHDDFMVPVAVERCMGFLADNPDYGVARGRVAMFALSRRDEQLAVSLVPHPMRGYEQADAVDRMLAHIERYASSFYSVHRRERLIESFRITQAATRNVIFFQYLSSSINALQGKFWCADELFYVRQGHADSWSGSLKQGNYEHWPLLITSPDFSRYYQEFRTALCGLIQSRFGLPPEVVGPRIDHAALGLFQRSYCGKEMDNPQEAEFLKRLNDPASADNRLLTSAIDFAVKYPETY